MFLPFARDALISCALLVASAGAAFAQAAYPVRPVAVVLGLQAGTGSDVALRIITDKLGASLGHPFVVQNVTGASGVLAAQTGARAARDGYTLVALSSGTMTIVPHMTRGGSFQPLKDLIPVAGIVAFPSILSVHRNVPARNIAEFLEYAMKNPGKLTYGSDGNGSVQHVAWESLKAKVGIDVLHVPYKGMAQATTDLAGGQIDALIQGVVGAIPFIKSGQVRPLAWTGTQRHPLLPDLPTLAESGVVGYDYTSWTGLYAPSGTPAAVLTRLNVEVRKAIQLPEVKELFTALAMDLIDLTPEQLAAQLKAEDARDRSLVRATGMRLE